MRALGLLTVLLIAGCTTVRVDDRAETTAPTPTPSGYLVAVNPPAQVFDGACGTLPLDSAWVLAAADDRIDPVNSLVAHNGGLRCSWANADRMISIVLLPETLVDLPVQSGCGEAVEGAATSCAIDAVAGGIRLSGHVLGGDPAQQAADRDELLALFAAAVPDNTRAVEPQRDPDAWPATLDCRSITDAADLKAATGLDAEFEAESLAFAPGSDAYVAPAELSLRSGYGSCGTAGVDGDDTFGIQYTTLGGGRWMEAAVREAKGARVVDVDGLQLVITVPSPVYGETVNVFDGVNWLQTDQRDDERLYPALAALVTALNS